MHSSDDFICTMTFAAMPTQRESIPVSNRLRKNLSHLLMSSVLPLPDPCSRPSPPPPSCKYANAHPPVNHQFGAWFLNCQPCSSSGPPSQVSWFGIFTLALRSRTCMMHLHDSLSPHSVSEVVYSIPGNNHRQPWSQLAFLFGSCNGFLLNRQKLIALACHISA